MFRNKLIGSVTAVMVASQIFALSLTTTVFAATLSTASVTISDSRPAATAVSYTHRFDFSASTSLIKCIKVLYSTTATGTTEPGAMVTGSSTNSSFSGAGLTPGSWTFSNATEGVIVYTNAAGETPTASGTLTFTNGNITNPNMAGTTGSLGTYYAKINTYNNTDCSTSPVDSTTALAIAITDGVTINVVVNPSLSFVVSGVAASTFYKGDSGGTNYATSAGCSASATAVNFPSDMIIDTNYDCAQNLLVSTNAAGGYAVTLRGVVGGGGSNLIDGSKTISEFTAGTNLAPAAWGATAEGFAYTSSDCALSSAGSGVARLANGTAGATTSCPGASGGGIDKFAQLTDTPAEVAYSSVPVSSDPVNVGYRVRLQGTTKAGSYSGTAIYTATPVF